MGGLPLWLNGIEGMQLRTNNTQWQQYMSGFVNMTATLVEPYLARNGGPIILSQVLLLVIGWQPSSSRCVRRLRTSTAGTTPSTSTGAAI